MKITDETAFNDDKMQISRFHIPDIKQAFLFLIREKGRLVLFFKNEKLPYFWPIVSLSMATADFSRVIFVPAVPTSITTVFSFTSTILP